MAEYSHSVLHGTYKTTYHHNSQDTAKGRTSAKVHRVEEQKSCLGHSPLLVFLIQSKCMKKMTEAGQSNHLLCNLGAVRRGSSIFFLIYTGRKMDLLRTVSDFIPIIWCRESHDWKACGIVLVFFTSRAEITARMLCTFTSILHWCWSLSCIGLKFSILRNDAVWYSF